MSFPPKVTLVEVSPRDGLQNETEIVPTHIKVEFINRLTATGLSVIEAGSFVSPKKIPQLADSGEVLQHIQKPPGVRYPVLVPNVKGLEHALQAHVQEIAVFTSPSEEFNQRNIHCSVAESLERISEVMQLAKLHHLTVRGYISCVIACPYEGAMPAEKVARLAQQLMELGCFEISLGDTIGVGTPQLVINMLQQVMTKIPPEYLAVHFHDTYGQALTNIYAALPLGITKVDSSVAGLGGCPYAQGASGNVASEDVLYLLNGLGIETGVDLQKLIAAGRFISDYLQHPTQSRVSRALL